MREELREIFFEEAARHVAAARERLGAAVSGADPEALAELYRSLHSVKGMAASMGLADLVDPAHRAEESVRRTREGEEPGGRPLAATLGPLIEELEERLRRHREADERKERAGTEGAPAPPPQVRMPPVRVAAERLDALTDLAARLATAQRRLEHLLGAPEDARVLEVRDRLGHAVRALSRELVGLRLLPVSTVTPVLRGAVQRWAAATGASVRFEIEGETIRLDRTLLERVFDPLGQLLRNAVVHGAAESRPDAPTTILLSVAHDADRLRFGVADDGRGLDPAAVARRARARGLLGDAAEVGDGEALRLLAHPGLSGREGADHLSGRGLGLAAARAAAEELGGELALWSARGRGFRALLRLPARLTILDAFVVEGSGQLFALPAASVREIREAWNVPDDTRRVLVLAEALGVRGAGSAPDKALVVEGVAGPEALLVGRVLERREIVVRPLGPPLEGVPPWAGATPLAEGGLALVVDPARVAAAEREGLSAAPDRATMRA